MDSALVLAFALRVVAMGLFITAAALLARAWRRSSLQEALAFSVLRRERRLALVTALLLLFSCLGLAVGLSAYQDLYGASFDVSQVVGGVLLLTASVATFALSWLGFGVLPAPAEARLIADAPEPYVAAVGVVDRKVSR
jgi:hypothetical protein